MAHWIWWLIVGIIGIVGGFFALLNPFAATIAAELIAAWFFLIAGAVQVIAAFQREGWATRIWALILAAAFLWLGFVLLFNPLAGIIALTMAAAITFLVTGVAKVFFAFAARGSGYFWPILLSGIVSVVLAMMVFSNFPQSAAVLLGVLLAVELLSNGAALVSFALFVRNNKDKIAAAA